jgi:photosystem II stability/assembly factor-like uncharacterized protein
MSIQAANPMVYTPHAKNRTMITTIRFRTLLLVAAALGLATLLPQLARSQNDASAFFPEMQWRMIGPFRGGRVLPALGVPGKPNQYMFGAVDGGVWKTENAGRTWRPVFDAEPIASIGAIAIAPSDPQTIYVGTGEADMRSDISYGDGMYKSTDGGATWRNIGLRDSRQIGAILVDPRDANVVLVAALGHAFGPNPERGVYRSIDGGATWKKVLGEDDNTGAIDLCSDPANPRVVYASLWQTRRPPWSVYAPTSGPGSGLYKSTDGGITWNQLTGHGFPSEGLGRVGIAIAPGNNGNRVYAVVDAREGGIYRSDDAGQNWRRVSSDARVWQRGWYFGGITADPRDPNVVYVADTALYRSKDGGENFEAIKGAPGGDDYHTLWIAPDDPQRMILGSDQGAAISVDHGATWSSWYNQPTAQFYHVIADNRFPYRVYGAQQDSGTASVTSRSDYGQITFRDWSPIGGEESGYIVVDRSDPNIIFGGGPYGVLRRFNWITAQTFDVSPSAVPFNGSKLRFTWTSPVVDSPQNAHVLYFGAQYVLRTQDAGQSWQAISPDLTLRTPVTTALPKKGEVGGVVYTIAPSPVRAGEIWAGTDNGLIHLTLDEGAHWSNVTPTGVEDWSMISLIEASSHDAATAYAAIDRHQVDDFHPYIYRTHDSGKTWQKTVAGLPENDYVHAVREDPVRKGLLFAGMESGVFVSFDDGNSWRPLQNNLPASSIRDLAIHGDDLVVATHGRSFWILDDVAPLREWSENIAGRDAYLFAPAHAVRIRRSENHDTPLPSETPVGTNPPAGAIFDYFLKSSAGGEVTLEIRDPQGNLARKYSSSDKEIERADPPEFSKSWLPKFVALSNAPGTHRFVWDLRYTQPPVKHSEYAMTAIIGKGTIAEPQGPLVLPGDYEVSLTSAGQTYKTKLTVEMDPRVTTPREDLVQQLALEQRIDTALTQVRDATEAIADARKQLKALQSGLATKPQAAAMAATLADLDKRAESIAGSTDVEWPAVPGGLAGLDSSLASLAISVGSADSAPTATASAAFAESTKRLDELLTQWQTLQKDFATLNKTLSD